MSDGNLIRAGREEQGSTERCGWDLYSLGRAESMDGLVLGALHRNIPVGAGKEGLRLPEGVKANRGDRWEAKHCA